MDGSMIITVLGSSGQIGAYLSEYLSRKGHIVREFDIVNGEHQDMTHIPNTYLRNSIMERESTPRLTSVASPLILPLAEVNSINPSITAAWT